MVSEDINYGGFGEEGYFGQYIWKNGRLTEIRWSEKGLTEELETTNLSALTGLDCSDNQLTKLDVSKNVNLTRLTCRKNQLTSLDLTNNKKLESLSCDDTVTVTRYNK